MTRTPSRGAGTPALPLSEQIRRALADDIVAGRLPPGMRLDEQGLAERFATSRTPIRDALRQLAATGLVEIRPRRGVAVTAIAPDAIQELFEALAAVEYHCARLAALRMSPGERHRLKELLDAGRAAAEAGDSETYVDINYAFHSLIYDGARNRSLRDIAEGLRRRLAPFRSAAFRSTDRMVSSLREHAAIVAAVLAEDGPAAGEAMQGHIGASTTTAMTFYRTSRERQDLPLAEAG